MKKILVVSFLTIALLAIGYLTFIKALIEITIGSIFLFIGAIALLVVWLRWKNRK